MKEIIILIITLLTYTSISAEEYQVVNEKVKVYSNPNFKTEVGFLTKGYKIQNLRAHNNKWSFINEDKIQGYILNNGIQEISQEQHYEKRSYSGIIG